MWEQVWRDEFVKYKTYSIVPIAENTCLYAKKVNEATSDLVSQLHGDMCKLLIDAMLSDYWSWRG